MNLEMQVEDIDYYTERSLVYQSKMVCDDVKKGSEYGELKMTISVNILKFNLFDSDSFFSRFLPIEETRREVLSKKWQIIFLELNKINIKDRNEKEQWLGLLKAGKEEVEMLRTSANEYIRECADKIISVNSDQKLRIQAELREKARMDENTRISSALRKGRAEGIEIGAQKRNNELIAKWKAKGMSDEEIKRLLE